MYSLSSIPFFDELSASQNILIAGIGGGFDVYCGIPIFLNLKNQNKNVYLANYSFTRLHETNAALVHPFCKKITPDTTEPTNGYFPEKYLSEWLEKNNFSSSVYAFSSPGVKQLQHAYQELLSLFSIDTVILVDGGTDGLMRGDEEDLGTFLQDYISLTAVMQIPLKKKVVASIGFGLDEVSHYRFLENVASVIWKDGFLGTTSLLSNSKEGKMYTNCVDYANKRMPHTKSIVNNAIIQSSGGAFGKQYIEGTDAYIFVNPLMSMYYFFTLDTVMSESHYFSFIKDTITVDEALDKIRLIPLKMQMRKTEKLPFF